MSDIPSTSNSTSKLSASSPVQNARKIRKKYDKNKLPTPPPDPREDKKESCSEKDFLEYLEQLQKHTANYSRSTSHLASALVAEDAFDHLEKLYKLMEQMLELRAQNAKLHRKIRDLEHLNNLEKMYRQVENLPDDDLCPELEKDTAFAETILESILYEPTKQPLKAKGSLRQSLMRRHRNRSCSATDKPVGLETAEGVDQQRRASLCTTNVKKSSKVSKWTRVKAAFKWEKASSNVGDTKSLDSGVSDVARYLRVPSTNDDVGHSPSDSGAAEISTPGTLSSASSNENFHKSGRRSPYEDLRSSDDEHSHVYSSHSKDDSNISPRSSQRSHRTPWARMKDMINTRNPVRKKSRMSTHSDDIQIDIDFCSDNEDVFEDNNKPRTYPNSNATSSAKLDGSSENDIPLVVRERYKSNDEQLLEMDEADCRKVSKWAKVKRAFLPSVDGHSDLGCKVNNDNDDFERFNRDPIQTEINRNYRNLQKKLSIEFQEKLIEWKRIKHNATSAPIPAQSGNVSDEPTQSSPSFMKKMEEWEKIKSPPVKAKSNIQMTSEENLPPEFKKKLQEWERIKKSSVRKSTKKLGDVPRWKSMQCPKTSESSHVEIPVISEEFRKKLEEWKQIKAAGYKSDETEKKALEDKTPSPTFQQMDSRVRKTSQDKELQWYEKELNKIEKEKNRLERERQKFMEKEEKLSKLRKSVIGGHKKDILVHTPSGFYKFEGISRKFTQKLYEWEKSKGIGPESSTFAYLNPEYIKTEIPKVKINGEDHTPPLPRSRSVDSIVISAMNIGCPLMSQPSSLSLNDMEDLENQCRVGSNSSSLDYLPRQNHETDGDEPEALIVEVEDFVEETAAPLKNFVEQHNPVYQCEEMRALVCLTPKVRRSESARAQSNYSLIEEALTSLRYISENEVEIRKIQIRGEKDSLIKIKEICDEQKNLVTCLLGKIRNLQEENSAVICNLSKENQNEKFPQITDILDVVQDLSTELITMAERLESKFECRMNEKTTKHFFDELHAQEIIEEIKCKLLELRRHLSYVCAASDSTTPQKRKLCRMKSIVCEKSSNDSQCTSSTQSSGVCEKQAFDSTNTETKCPQNQGAIKKRLRYRIETIRKKSLHDSDEEEEIVAEHKKYPKLLRSRTISDGSTKSLEQNEGCESKNINIFPAVTKSTYPDSPTRVTLSDSPVTIFVKTTRKLFTPLVERSLQDSEKDSPKQNDDNQKFETNDENINEEESQPVDTINKALTNAENTMVTGLPPLHSSPVTQKKYVRDMSPSIRLMLNKYQQKITEQDVLSKSGGSSGSASPVAWRSPIAERRVRAQTEKYQEEIIKLSPVSLKKELHKSTSQGHVQSMGKSEIKSPIIGVSRQKSILKSSSAANLVQRRLYEYSPQHNETPDKEVRSTLDRQYSLQITNFEEPSTSRISSELRQQKLKKAKEEFLNSSSATPLDSKIQEDIQETSRTNRLSTISVDSSSSASSISPGVLVKSISAGMINIVADAYKHFENKPREYVSLPRNTRSDSSSKSTLANLASKFRKVKMRKGKEKDREQYVAVSELCRQSLVVDINENDGGRVQAENLANNANSTQNSQQMPITKSSSWIRKTLFFKK
ncbi:uncharacterized protein LOC123315031 isoform X2 [Coccinella septempunctata]|uniref:uncharacterized protein LOC123315031 isoform X2 n=1 Tax=Coccinella septempunctata TaxID=41139 RepID=UPI001D0731CB|nr:uncharacterized protein LOC123315031 isoform X2 [Coccinella septempunctata]